MIFQLKNLIRDTEELLVHLNKKKFITYVNVNSFRVGGNLKYNFNFYADGRPVALLFRFLTMGSVKRLTALSIDDFWIDFLRGYRVILIGHEEGMENLLMSSNSAFDIKIDHVIHGYGPIDIVKAKLKEVLSLDEPSIVFLAMGQPKQEEFLISCSEFNGIVPFICVGAYFKQRSQIVDEYFPVLDRLWLTPIIRFWKHPFELLKRTFISLFYIPFRLKL